MSIWKGGHDAKNVKFQNKLWNSIQLESQEGIKLVKIVLLFAITVCDIHVNPKLI